MKKLILIILILCNLCFSKTINLLNWEPEYKYKSLETYSLEDARAYCKNKKQCQIKKENDSYRIYNKIKNCPDVVFSNMDSYISDAFTALRFKKHCLDTNLYIFNRVEKYLPIVDITYSYYIYIWKIEKKSNIKFIKFKEN